MDLTEEFFKNSNAIHQKAMQSLFERLDSLCDGAIAVDRNARVVWINEKYIGTLGLGSPDQALGRDVEDVIPNSLMRQVVQTGEPILLDILEFGDQSFVVTRMPLQGDTGDVIGAIGFVLYDKLQYLKPLVEKFAKLQAELAQINKTLAAERQPRYSLSNYVGNSPPVLAVKRQVRRAAEQDTTVLLLGETGTGKELIAQAIHGTSSRARMPFVAINVAAIPDSLLEAELFGTTPGAFTGAERKARVGKFQIADGGTLFLDEIGDMPMQLQAKLLRVLQEQEFEPLGSNKVTKVDVRIVAATNVDLRKLVDKRLFRADLYYRINVLTIHLPPLRTILSDLEAIAEVILEQIAARTGAAPRRITPDGLMALSGYDWPGNVRELRNALERAWMQTDSSKFTSEDFATLLPIHQEELRVNSVDVGVRKLVEAVSEFEQATLRAALEAAGGRATEAARLLGISRAAYYKKAAKFGLKFHRDTE